MNKEEIIEGSKKDSAMTVDDLLKPRYKVIADYPKSIYEVGTVLDAGWRSGDLLYCDHDGPRMSHYPHLFKRLEWHEDRTPEEMPTYIFMKTAKPSVIQKVDAWYIDSDGYWWADYNKKSWLLNMWAIDPTTKEQYDSYINKKP